MRRVAARARRGPGVVRAVKAPGTHGATGRLPAPVLTSASGTMRPGAAPDSPRRAPGRAGARHRDRRASAVAGRGVACGGGPRGGAGKQAEARGLIMGLTLALPPADLHPT